MKQQFGGLLFMLVAGASMIGLGGHGVIKEYGRDHMELLFWSHQLMAGLAFFVPAAIGMQNFFIKSLVPNKDEDFMHDALSGAGMLSFGGAAVSLGTIAFSALRQGSSPWLFVLATGCAIVTYFIARAS